MIKYLRKSLRAIELFGNYPQVDTISSALGSKIRLVGEEEYLLFSSNSYLSLTNNERCKSAAIEAVKKYGTGSGSSRIVSGTFSIHAELEDEIAKFKGKESGMVLTSGYSTNVSLIPVLINGFTIFKGHEDKREKVIFSDEFNHASLIDGIKLSKANVEIYKHSDLQDLESKIQKYPKAKKLIVTDSIFSMDGDLARMGEIVQIKKKYGCGLLIDEAHATGIFGESGRGVADFFKVTDDVDIIMGTFSKALGSIGGYIVGDKSVIKILKVAVRGYVFSTALPPADIAVSLEALKIIKEKKMMGHELLEKSKYLRDKLNEIGFSTMQSESQIIPILIGNPKKALMIQESLRDKKIIAPCIQWPAVPRETSRIRFSLMLEHTHEDIDYLITSLKEIKEKIKI